MELKELYNESFYHDKSGMLLQGDCLDWMNKIPDKTIDMILCDLPYGTTKCAWDIIIPFDKLWEQYLRISKSNCAIILTAKQPFTSFLITSNLEMFKYVIIWEKNKPTSVSLANKRPLSYHEDICIFYTSQPVYNPQMVQGLPNHNFKPYRRDSETQGNTQFQSPKLDGLKFPKSVLKIDREHAKTIHPTQKPLELFEYMIKTYSNENMIILDNCSGSCTTAIACKNLNRRWICIEKEQNYCEISTNRIKNWQKVEKKANKI